MDKHIKARISSINHTGNAIVRGRNGQATPVKLSDQVISQGVDENDMVLIRVFNDKWIAVEIIEQEPDELEEYDLSDLMEEY